MMRMNSIEYLGQRVKVKVTMDIHGKNLVDTMGNEPFFASSLKYHGERMSLIDFGGQRSNVRSLWTYIIITL